MKNDGLGLDEILDERIIIGSRGEAVRRLGKECEVVIHIEEVAQEGMKKC